jgi:hypothetical protein
MSLINDALKKAQKQRTGESQPPVAMPGVGGEPAARIARRAKPVGFNSLLLRIGLGLGALVVLVVGGFFLLQVLLSRSSTPPPAKPALVAATPAQPPVAAPGSAAAPSSASTFVLPIPAVSTPTPATSLTLALESKPVVTLPIVVAPNAEPAKLAPPPKLAPKSIAYIESLRVAGIRASATDSKVLMNDHVYRVGDTVEHELGIKIIEIAAGALTFEDERGARYTRTF